MDSWHWADAITSSAQAGEEKAPRQSPGQIELPDEIGAVDRAVPRIPFARFDEPQNSAGRNGELASPSPYIKMNDHQKCERRWSWKIASARPPERHETFHACIGGDGQAGTRLRGQSSIRLRGRFAGTWRQLYSGKRFYTDASLHPVATGAAMLRTGIAMAGLLRRRRSNRAAR
jgi:hypothetical protein